MSRRFGNRLPDLERANKPGETIRFKFKGTRAAIYDVIGPDCGQVIVTLDDQPPVVRPRFDSYCTYPRLATLLIGTDLPEAVHTVKIEIHPDQPDKAKILSQRHEKIDEPKRFNDTAFYPGACCWSASWSISPAEIIDSLRRVEQRPRLHALRPPAPPRGSCRRGSR